MACEWVTSSGTQCKNNVLMDGMCSRHLKQKCSICLEQVKSTNSANTKRLTCGHSFHLECILKWFVNSDACPTCRKVQSKDVLITYKDSIEEVMRKKYKDAIKTLEIENRRLNETLRRQTNYLSESR